MGTTYSVKFAPETSVDLLEVGTRVREELEQVNQQMSTYIDDSELSRFNQSTTVDDWFGVSAETAAVVELANQIAAKTDGAFDVTVGPLVDLWGFGPTGQPQRIPESSEIAEAKRSVGYAMLQSRQEPAGLSKSVGALQVDLSAIAKGHGVDRIAKVLDSLGVQTYFVEIGGEVRVAGSRVDGQPWRVGIESPEAGTRELLGILEVQDVAVATSGDYRNFFEIDGRRYSHTIDPRTGEPVQDPIVSATALSETCAEADAIATSMMCLGFQSGIAVANENGWAVLVIGRNDDGSWEIGESERFDQLASSWEIVEETNAVQSTGAP